MPTRRSLLLGLAPALSLAQTTTPPLALTDLAIKTIYHSPETPGYTSWVGCWLMPGGTPMISFHQATGPLKGRYRASQEILHRLSWPPPGKPEFANYDMTGLDMKTLHLVPNGDLSNWQSQSTEHVSTPMNGWTCEAEDAAKDGTIYRAVEGQYLPFFDVPQAGYWQRSTDGSKTWSEPAAFFDLAKWSSFPKRLRFLRDGRIAVTGAVIPWQPHPIIRNDWGRLLEPAVWFSDDQGKTWSDPLLLWDDKSVRPSEEVDFAELPNGDLLTIIRVDAAKVRYQTTIRKQGKSWRPDPVRKLWIPHSGHPELLLTREGVVIHFAKNGIAGSRDEGKTWSYFEGHPVTGHYPRSVQLPDGRIFCVYHTGADDYYGQRDQRIESITFRLKS